MARDNPHLTTEDTLPSDEFTHPSASGVKPSAASSFAVGQRLGHYRLLGEIGRGNMGVVYAAEDGKLDRKVAIKMLEREGDPKHRQRLIREAKAMARLSHPNVVSVHEIGEHEGTSFIVMEFVEGQTLRSWLDLPEQSRRGPRAAAPRGVAEILAVFADAGRGLAAIHEAGLIHRDVKPDNLMIRATGQVLVMDLGIARGEFKPAMLELELEAGADDGPTDLTRTGAMMGSPAYMAPEQFLGREVTPKTDQFSFCVALWEALYGARPFRGSNLVALVNAVTTGAIVPASRSDVPRAVRRLLERGLRLDPSERFDSMPALLDALASSSRPRLGLRGGLALAAGVLAAAAVLGLGLRSWQREDVQPARQLAPAPASPRQPAAPAPAAAPTPGNRQITATGTATRPALSPDGDDLVYVVDDDVIHFDLATGETRKLPLAVEDIYAIAFDPDGSLLFSGKLDGQFGTYAMPDLTGAPEQIGAVPIFCRFVERELLAGTFLARKTVDLYRRQEVVDSIEIEGEHEWLLGLACDPVHDRMIVHQRFGPTHTLRLVELDGKAQRIVLEGPAELAQPQFDPGGERLYFLATRAGRTNLEVVRVDDPDPQPRVVTADIQANGIALANTGRLAYARIDQTASLWRVPDNAGSLDAGERLMHAANTRLADVAVSPDEAAAQLAWVDGRRLVVRSLADGTERELATGEHLSAVAWSADGETLAYAAHQRKTPKIWTIPAAGGAPTPHEATQASLSTDIAWAPLERLLYRKPQNRNFALLDPTTDAERPLIADDSVGWAFSATPSPLGDRVAVFCNRDPRGTWTVDLDDGEASLLAAGELFPIAWTADAAALIVQDRDGDAALVKLLRVPAAGGEPQPWRSVYIGPRRQGTCEPLATGELLCAVLESASDIWIAEGVE